MLAKAAFVKFQTTLIKVLGVFESQKLRHGRSGNGLTALGDGDGGAESYCVKYLTSSKLLHLQLRDPAFRRHFLLQVSVSVTRQRNLHHRVDSFCLPNGEERTSAKFPQSVSDETWCRCWCWVPWGFCLLGLKHGTCVGASRTISCRGECTFRLVTLLRRVFDREFAR